MKRIGIAWLLVVAALAISGSFGASSASARACFKIARVGTETGNYTSSTCAALATGEWVLGITRNAWAVGANNYCVLVEVLGLVSGFPSLGECIAGGTMVGEEWILAVQIAVMRAVPSGKKFPVKVSGKGVNHFFTIKKGGKTEEVMCTEDTLEGEIAEERVVEDEQTISLKGCKMNGKTATVTTSKVKFFTEGTETLTGDMGVTSAITIEKEGASCKITILPSGNEELETVTYSKGGEELEVSTALKGMAVSVENKVAEACVVANGENEKVGEYGGVDKLKLTEGGTLKDES